MARGRKNKPKNMKVIQGTFRDDRTNKNAPDPENDLPMSPSWLPADAREYFGILKERIDSLGLASRSYTEMLALTAHRIMEINELNELIADEGPTYETQTVTGDRIIKANPAVAQRSRAMTHLQSLLAEFGLSPAAIQKVSIKKPEGEKKNPYDRYRKKS